MLFAEKMFRQKVIYMMVNDTIYFTESLLHFARTDYGVGSLTIFGMRTLQLSKRTLFTTMFVSTYLETKFLTLGTTFIQSSKLD